MVQGIFQEYNPTQRLNTSDTLKKTKFFQCGNTLVSRIPDSHKVLYCCWLFAFKENPFHFLSSSIPADLRSSKTKFQKPPTFHHAQSVYSQVQRPDEQTHFDQTQNTRLHITPSSHFDSDKLCITTSLLTNAYWRLLTQAYSTQDMKVWRYTSTPPYIIMAHTTTTLPLPFQFLFHLATFKGHFP